MAIPGTYEIGREGSDRDGIAVVHVIARLNVGGAAAHAIALAAGAGRGALLAAGSVEGDEADMSAEAVRLGVRLHRVRGLGRSVRLFGDLVAFLDLVRLFRRLRPRIVHTHTAKAGTLGRLAALVAGVPVRVHTFHGHVFSGYFSPLKSRLIRAVERSLARVTTCIVALSASQREELVTRYRIAPRRKVRIVPLGMDLSSFAPASSHPLRAGFRNEIAAGDACVVVTVGRLAPIKNQAMLLDVAARLIAVGRNCLFVIVGGGAEEARLKARAERLGIANRVRFLGWRADLARIYAGADIVALTSDNEGTPVALIEALAAGRCVVATDVGGVRDVLDNGRLGELVAPRDVPGFCRAIERLMDDAARSARISAAAAESAPLRFDLRRLHADTDALYRELLTPVARARPDLGVRAGAG